MVSIAEILMAQRHSPEDDVAFIEHVARFMADSRYIRVDGKPLLIVYRPGLLPAPAQTAERWRAWCRGAGLGEIYLAYSQSFEVVDPAEFGFDAAIEFPPNRFSLPNIADGYRLFGEDNGCAVYDWRDLAGRRKNREQPHYKLLRGVCPAWDNTARRKNKSTIFVNSAPSRYQRWLEAAICDTAERQANPDERLVFINAWNEWAEGAYLEPDRRFGYAYLEATRMALTRADLKMRRTVLDAATASVAIIIHAYYLDVFEELIECLGDVDPRHKLFITTSPDREAGVKSIMQSTSFNHEIFVFENRGRDVLPFLSLMKKIDLDSYSFILKLHTKKSRHRNDGDQWRRQAFLSLATPSQLNWIVGRMCSDPRIGVVGPQDHIVPMNTYVGANLENIAWLAARLGVDVDLENDRFVAGTMFVARTEALEPILNIALGGEDFEAEASQLDGTMAHAIERVVTYSARAAGFEIAAVRENDADHRVALRPAINLDFAFAAPS